MDCPRGHGPLEPSPRGALSVEYCGVCGGEWLAQDELQALEASAVNDPVVLSGMIEYQPHESEIRCPVCGGKMHGFDYRANPLELDACEAGHGYWLDGGEESRVRELIRQRARDLNRAASAELSFGGFLDKMRSGFGGPKRAR